MKKILVVGGSNGIGLSIVRSLQGYEKLTIIDKVEPDYNFDERVFFKKKNLLDEDYSFLNDYQDIDTLIITSGFGEVKSFENISDEEIIKLLTVNTISTIRIIKSFYSKLNSEKDFYCAVMGSISGFISSPLFSVYGASKAALCKFIESVNTELIMEGSVNQILNVSPGSIKGTKFEGGNNNFEDTMILAKEIIENMVLKQDLLIPQYDEVFKNVLKRYHNNYKQFGIESYEYKAKTRIKKP